MFCNRVFFVLHTKSQRYRPVSSKFTYGCTSSFRVCSNPTFWAHQLRDTRHRTCGSLVSDILAPSVVFLIAYCRLLPPFRVKRCNVGCTELYNWHTSSIAVTRINLDKIQKRESSKQSDGEAFSYYVRGGGHLRTFGLSVVALETPQLLLIWKRPRANMERTPLVNLSEVRKMVS